MDFVTACSNIRCFVFGIAQKSRFDTKCKFFFVSSCEKTHFVFCWVHVNFLFSLAMAGNIIPAIASTNAIVGGFIVMTAFKVLKEDWFKCNSVSFESQPKKLIAHFQKGKDFLKCAVMYF